MATPEKESEEKFSKLISLIYQYLFPDKTALIEKSINCPPHCNITVDGVKYYFNLSDDRTKFNVRLRGEGVKYDISENIAAASAQRLAEKIFANRLPAAHTLLGNKLANLQLNFEQ